MKEILYEDNSSVRLDIFLKGYIKQENEGGELISRESVKNYLLPMVKVNGKEAKPSVRLSKGDTITIPKNYFQEVIKQIEESRNSVIEPQKGDLNIVQETSEYLIIKKPKGVPVHPGANNPKDTIANFSKYYLQNSDDYDKKLERAGLVHRLDKPVGGLMVLAKTQRSQKHLKEQFESHSVLKIYLAQLTKLPDLLRKSEVDEKSVLIEKLQENWMADNEQSLGEWEKIEGYISRDPINRIKMRFTLGDTPNSKNAVTFLKLVNIQNNEVMLIIKTGRMHQIRASLEYLDSPIVGDTLYGKGRSIPEEIQLDSIGLGFMDLDGNRVFYSDLA